MDKPKWDDWQALGNAKVWQAPLLSLDRDPNAIIFDAVDWNDITTREDNDTLPPTLDNAYRHRLWLLLKGLLSPTYYFPNDGEGRHIELQDEVPLGNFAAWCQLEKLTVPRELAAIANTYGGVERLREEAAERGKKGQCIGWWNGSLDANTYWHQTAVSYGDAAKLLSGHNPKKTTDEDAECTTMFDNTRTITRRITPEDYKRLRDEFSARAHNETDRKLAYWLNVARSKQLRYHGWIDAWLAAMGIEAAGAEPGADVRTSEKGQVAVRQSGAIATPGAQGDNNPPSRPVSADTRRNALTAVIETAKGKAENRDDYQSVWAALVALAESSNKPSPLLGFVEGEGVKYQGDNDVKFFTKRNLADRMRRAKPR